MQKKQSCNFTNEKTRRTYLYLVNPTDSDSHYLQSLLQLNLAIAVSSNLTFSLPHSAFSQQKISLLSTAFKYDQQLSTPKFTRVQLVVIQKRVLRLINKPELINKLTPLSQRR